MALQVPTSPNVCFYTTWGKQNKRNMHWKEQQTSTNWRLDRIKIWSRWSELTKYIIYLLTAVLSAIKRVAGDAGDTFVFQQDSAPAHWLAKRSNSWSAKPQTSSLRICGPQWALTSIQSITSSGGHATAGLSNDVQECEWTQEAPVEIWIGLKQNIIDTAINEWRKRQRACARARADIPNIYCRQLNNWTIG